MQGYVRGIAAASVVAVVTSLVGSLLPVKAQTSNQSSAATPEIYSTRVRPILDANCARCHGGFNHRGGLNMDTRAGMMKGGKDGAVIVPGDPAKSLLVSLIRHEGKVSEPMPPNRPRISDADIGTIEEWIKAGAIMPADVPKP